MKKLIVAIYGKPFASFMRQREAKQGHAYRNNRRSRSRRKKADQSGKSTVRKRISLSPIKNNVKQSAVSAARSTSQGWDALLALQEKDRDAVMRYIFSPEEANLSWGRIPIGASGLRDG